MVVVGAAVVVVGAAVVVVGAAVVVVGAAVVVVGAAVVVVGAAVVVVGAAVVVVGAAVVVVEHTKLPSGEPPLVQPSQQLPSPTQVAPPRGALHLAALLLIEHLALPRRSMRQQVTAPALPHVDRAAHDTTSPWHSFGSAPVSTRPAATSLTQRT